MGNILFPGTGFCVFSKIIGLFLIVFQRFSVFPILVKIHVPVFATDKPLRNGFWFLGKNCFLRVVRKPGRNFCRGFGRNFCGDTGGRFGIQYRCPNGKCPEQVVSISVNSSIPENKYGRHFLFSYKISLSFVACIYCYHTHFTGKKKAENKCSNQDRQSQIFVVKLAYMCRL